MLNIKRLTGVFISALLITALLITATVQSAFAGSIFDNFKNMLSYNEQKVSVKLDGKNITFPDVQPYVNEDSRTLVPVRFVSEAMGCDVKWEEANQMVIITKSPKRILLQIGQNWAIVNDTKTDVRKEFDTKAVLKDDRTMVPLRFVSEMLGAGVAWDEVNNTVVIRSDGKIEPVPTITPTLAPVITDHRNYVEHFDLVEGFNPPDDFIKPDIDVIHFMSGAAPYFDVVLRNSADYAGLTSTQYSFKTTCLNYDIVNSISAGNGRDVIRVDTWRNLGEIIQGYIDSNARYENLITFVGDKTYRRYSMNPDDYKIRIEPGMKLDMEVRFKYNNFEQVYRKTVTVYDK